MSWRYLLRYQPEWFYHQKIRWKMKETEKSNFFKHYKWKKVSRAQYYRNLNLWMSKEEAITFKKWQPKNRIVSTKFSKEMKRYHQQEWEKAERWVFYQRLYQWRTKEEAIKKEYNIHYKEYRKDKPLKKYEKKYQIKEQKQNDWINIKYTKEEADIFKKSYEEKIQELSDELQETEDIEKSKKIQNQLQEIEAEYQNFISINDYYE